MITFDDYIAKLPVERQKAIEARANELIYEIQLEQMRKARKISQRELAAQLNVSQPAVAKMEREKDMKISTLRRIAQAMGGTLKIAVEFPEGISYSLTR